jgi:hypothetical protein
MTIQHAGRAVHALHVSRWREAHRLASEAERTLFDAAMMHEWGQGPKPAAALCDATTQLRATEQALFARASLEFGDFTRA